jgi:tellurite resistance protein
MGLRAFAQGFFQQATPGIKQAFQNADVRREKNEINEREDRQHAESVFLASAKDIDTDEAYEELKLNPLAKQYPSVITSVGSRVKNKNIERERVRKAEEQTARMRELQIGAYERSDEAAKAVDEYQKWVTRGSNLSDITPAALQYGYNAARDFEANGEHDKAAKIYSELGYVQKSQEAGLKVKNESALTANMQTMENFDSLSPTAQIDFIDSIRLKSEMDTKNADRYRSMLQIATSKYNKRPNPDADIRQAVFQTVLEDKVLFENLINLKKKDPVAYKMEYDAVMSTGMELARGSTEVVIAKAQNDAFEAFRNSDATSASERATDAMETALRFNPRIKDKERYELMKYIQTLRDSYTEAEPQQTQQGPSDVMGELFQLGNTTSISGGK